MQLLRDVLSEGVADTFFPKLIAYFRRQGLLSFNIKKNIARKDFEIFVGNSPSETTPVAAGIVPQAPGTADTPDYGSLINLPFTRGRYIRLQAKGPWQPNAYMGLSEVQVLGF